MFISFDPRVLSKSILNFLQTGEWRQQELLPHVEVAEQVNQLVRVTLIVRFAAGTVAQEWRTPKLGTLSRVRT